MVYFWIAILFVIGMIMIAKPELIWKIDHAFTVKNGEPTEFSIALIRVGGTLILILGIVYLLLSVTDFIKNTEQPVNSENTDAASDVEILKETEKNEIPADFSFADLKKTKDTEFMEILTVEQREWVEEKEKAIAEAGAEVIDNSKQSQLMNLKGMELTKERVYELMELFLIFNGFANKLPE